MSDCIQSGANMHRTGQIENRPSHEWLTGVLHVAQQIAFPTGVRRTDDLVLAQIGSFASVRRTIP